MVHSSGLVHLLVDGYNMIGAWKTLRPRGNGGNLFRDRSQIEAARTELIRLLIDYSAFQGYATQVVFDAQQRIGPSHCEQMTEHLAVYYTDFGETADTYIERCCSLSRPERVSLGQRIIVATSDRVHQLTVVGYGAEWMSAQQLCLDVQAVNLLIQQKQQSVRPSQRRGLAHQLDPAAKQRLEQLRRG
jgi:uncharacterized protein